MRLHELFPDVPGDIKMIEITGLAYDEHGLSPGTLFFCLRGPTRDGHDFAAEVIQAGAVALVAPSFAEGFGLPVVESLAAGTPALVSDIAAHREVGGDMVLYADPVDGPSWISAIETLMDPRAQLSPEMRAKIARYQPMTWKAHVEDAMRIIERVQR